MNVINLAGKSIAYREGYEAFAGCDLRDDRTTVRNPYTWPSVEWSAWEGGFVDAVKVYLTER